MTAASSTNRSQRARPSPLVYRAIADPTRRLILDRLMAGPQTVNQIAERFPMSRPAISKHLRLLRRARLVRPRRLGRRRFYQLCPEPLQQVDHWISHYRLFWAARLVELKEFVEQNRTEPGSLS